MSSPHRFRLHHDATGRPRAEALGPASGDRLVAQFLASDLAGDRSYCDRILAEGWRLAEGRSAGWATTGNAFALELGRDHATLRPLFPEGNADSATLPTREFLDLVDRWRGLIEPRAGDHP